QGRKRKADICTLGRGSARQAAAGKQATRLPVDSRKRVRPKGCGRLSQRPGRRCRRSLRIASVLSSRASRSFLRVLCNLRWLAIIGQALTVAVVTGPMQVALPAAPLWTGIGALAVFNG